MRVVGVVNGEVIIYRPLCGGCAVRGADMRGAYMNTCTTAGLPLYSAPYYATLPPRIRNYWGPHGTRGAMQRGDMPDGGRYARRARGNGRYGDLAGGERRGVWRGDMRAIARREGEGLYRNKENNIIPF